MTENSRKLAKLFVFCVAIVSAASGAELLLHWFLARNQESFLFAVYVTRDSGNKYFFAGTIDYILPAAILGFAIGWKSWPQIKLSYASAIVFGAVAVIATGRPAYRALFGSAPFTEIWGDSAFVFSHPFVFLTLTTFLMGFFFLQGAYGFRQDWAKRAGRS